MWNVIQLQDKYIAFCSLRGTLLFFVACTDTSPWGALEVQSSNSNTNVSRVQVHPLSEGATRGLGVRLTCQLMHFHSSKYQNDSSL